MSPEPLAALRSCAFFAELSREQLSRLVKLAVRRTYARGQLIFRQGDPPPGLFLVVSGLVRVYKLAPTGKEHVLHLAGPGQTFGEVAALGEFACPAWAQADQKSVCLVLPAKPFLQLLRADPELSLQVLRGMAVWVKHLVGLLEAIVLRDAAGRVAAYLLQAGRSADGTVHLPGLKKHVASHLNLTSETLSRTLGQFHDERLIRESRGNRIELLDRARLQEVAEGRYPRI